MSAFKKISQAEIDRVNQLQRSHFNKLYLLFEPPLPEGVAERLAEIVAAGKIAKGEAVLDVGSGTGILIPLMQQYDPGRIFACDLSEAMLRQINKNYSGIETIQADVRDLALPDASLDVVFINACYPNIVDKDGAFANIARMLKASGRMVISHPLGKKFIHSLKENAPYPLDYFPQKAEAIKLFKPYGFDIIDCVDETALYILVAVKRSEL